MSTTVTVTTGARLHFGPLAAAGSTGGRFGGVGMMISTPRYVLAACRADQDRVIADQSIAGRAMEFVRRLREADSSAIAAQLFRKKGSAPQEAAEKDAVPFFAQSHPLPPCRIEFHEAIPSHAGLGSGTQLGLAVARALSELQGERDVPVEVLARRTGRGLRSAIGIHGFARGGFLVDGGRVGSGRLGTLVARVEFPDSWRLLLVAPMKTKGLSGADEQRAFAAQPPMPLSLTGELCRIALMDWLPSLMEADFARVANAMYEFGSGVGRFFEPVQGGVFAHSAMGRLADEVRRRGFAGVAQSSWGPTICVLCDSESVARQLASDLAGDARWADCTFQVAEPLNRGAGVAISG